MRNSREARCGFQARPGRQTEAFLALIALLLITSATIGIILDSFLHQLHVSALVHCTVLVCLSLIPSRVRTGAQVPAKVPALAINPPSNSADFIDKVGPSPSSTRSSTRPRSTPLNGMHGRSAPPSHHHACCASMLLPPGTIVHWRTGDVTTATLQVHLPPSTPRTTPSSPSSSSSGHTIAPWRPGSIDDAPDVWSAAPAAPLAAPPSQEVPVCPACMPTHPAHADLDFDMEDEMLLPCPPRMQREGLS